MTSPARDFITTSAMIVAMVALIACSPTVKVEAPDKPIEINVNVKIEQEVRIKVERDLEQLILDNPDIFPNQGTTP